VLPGIVQQFTVEPSELELEMPYIENSIAQTREAYLLDEMESQPYDARPPEDLSRTTIEQNTETIENIRLWDPRLIIQTYRQLQEIRLYYQFYNVDVDRYRNNECDQQMMISARELAQELIDQSYTWVNLRHQYKDGHGVVLDPLAQEAIQGDPRM